MFFQKSQNRLVEMKPFFCDDPDFQVLPYHLYCTFRLIVNEYIAIYRKTNNFQFFFDNNALTELKELSDHVIGWEVKSFFRLYSYTNQF